MWYSFKKPAQTPKQSNIFKIITSLLNLKLQIIRLAQGHWSWTKTHENRCFIATPMKKTYLAVHFTKVCFCQFADRKVVGLMPKYYLLAGDTSQGFFFPYIR